MCVQQEDYTQFWGRWESRCGRDPPVMINAADKWLLRWGCHGSDKSGPEGLDHSLSEASFESQCLTWCPATPSPLFSESNTSPCQLHFSLLGKGTQCCREASQWRITRVGIEFSPWLNVWPWQGSWLLLISVSWFIKDSMPLFILSLRCYCQIWDSAWKKTLFKP